jgi:hypothetical protein
LDKDPELLPGYPRREWNRAQFAFRYLKKSLNDKNKNLTYTKRNPKTLLHPKYFHEIEKRYNQTGHICSFSTFLTAFL